MIDKKDKKIKKENFYEEKKDEFNKSVTNTLNRLASYRKKPKRTIRITGNYKQKLEKSCIKSNTLKHSKVFIIVKSPQNLSKRKSKTEKKYKGNINSFAHGLNFYKLFWVFFVGCFIGVVVEVLFGLIVDHKFESRAGVIYGPFNPVYGFGAVALTGALYWMRNQREIFIFIAGGILGGFFEYICSWYQEIFIGTVSWDYTGQIGNIGGRTSIFYMAMWGGLALAWLKYIYPLLSNLIEKLPNKSGKFISWVLIIFMVFNCAISSAAVNRMTARHHNIPPENVFDEFLDDMYPDEFLNSEYSHMMYTSDGTYTDENDKHPDDPQPIAPKGLPDDDLTEATTETTSKIE